MTGNIILSEHQLKMHNRRTREDAIDDFVKAIKEKFPKDKNAIANAEIIAKQLKEQKE